MQSYQPPRSDSSQMNADIASKMLSAITREDVDAAPVEYIPPDEQKRYLKRYIDAVSIQDRKSIGGILAMNGKLNAFNWCSEGAVINLDTLPEYIIDQMYNLLSYKMAKMI